MCSTGWWLGLGIDQRYVSFSDGVYGYLGSRIALHGPDALYSDYASSLPPLLPLLAGAVWELDPRIEAYRLAIAVIHVATALLTWLVARRLGLPAWWATGAAVLASVSPIAVLLRGLDGELLLTPLVLAVLWCVLSRQRVLLALLLAMGALIKLTWIMLMIGAVAAVLVQRGPRAAAAVAAMTTATCAVAWIALAAAFDWRWHDIVDQLVEAQLGSGLQLHTVLELAVVLSLLLWPVLILAAAARQLDRSFWIITGSATASLLYAAKQGTFFNVIEPAEPLLAIAAVAGARGLLARGTVVGRVLVAVCGVGVVLHSVSLVNTAGRSALPFPAGAAIYDVDNERLLQQTVRLVRVHAATDDAVLVNPYLALASERTLVGDQPDWFLLHALNSRCEPHRAIASRHCDSWPSIKSRARGSAAVVGVDKNVVIFDPRFERDVVPEAARRLGRTASPPLSMELWARAADDTT